jgi:hypothetical protein
MIYMANGDHSVNVINARGLSRRQLSYEQRVAMAVETRLGLAQITHLTTPHVCGIFNVTAGAVKAGIRDWVAVGGIPQLAAIAADVVNGSGHDNSNGHSDRAAQFAETLKAMDPNELAAAFKVAGSEVIWGALVRPL